MNKQTFTYNAIRFCFVLGTAVLAGRIFDRAMAAD